MATRIEETRDNEALLPGSPEGAEESRGWRPSRFAALSGLAAVVGGACALAVVTGAAGGEGRAASLDAASGVPVVELTASGRTKLMIEGDLGDIVKGHTSRDVKPAAGESLRLSAEKLFDEVVKSSGLNKELTDEEQVAFKGRFVDKMTDDLKSDDPASRSVHDYFHSARAAIQSEKPAYTQALAKSLNDANLGFHSEMKPWMVQESQATFQSRLGRKPIPKEKQEEGRKRWEARPRPKDVPTPPDSFDARDEWPDCGDIIGRIHDQGHCGSCWAFAATGVLDSRMCIASRGEYNGDLAKVSRTYATSCSVEWDGCLGGWEMYVYDKVETTGLPTSSCMPYFADGAGSEHFQQHGTAPTCGSLTECDGRYPRALEEDYFIPRGVGDWGFVPEPDDQIIILVKAVLYQEGPISFAFYASNAFMGYTDGIFGEDCGNDPNHAVQAIGWGPGYWMAQNSWGPYWGDAGRMKVAPCVPVDFTVPGTIMDNVDYPLPIPEHTLTTTIGPDPDPVDDTTCQTDENGCVTSPNWPNNYPDDSRCEIPEFGRISVKAFATENGYDTLTVNGNPYSGFDGPNGVKPNPGSWIVWSSDHSISDLGWKICPLDKPCPSDGEGCWMSPGYPGNYADDDACFISRDEFCSSCSPDSCTIDVLDFDVERSYDTLEVNGVFYSGTTGPAGVSPTDDMVFTSDSSVNERGFKICRSPKCN